jgi:hypothetical protein
MTAHVELSHIELLALAKLAIICRALGQSLDSAGARREQLALTGVLDEVVARASVKIASQGDSEDAAKPLRHKP